MKCARFESKVCASVECTYDSIITYSLGYNRVIWICEMSLELVGLLKLEMTINWGFGV